MTAELWTKVRALVEEAMMLPLAERSAFLAEQTTDALVRSEAEQLLNFEREASEIFAVDNHRWSLDAPAAEANLSGLVLGSYRLLEEIGHGGMGSVYLAERADGTYQQRVALKILQEGIFSARLVERFAEERQILARLSHPGIARLLDGGVTIDGRPYLVLEYVDGRQIDRYCEDEALDTDARLRLFLKVADAVQSAHQQLVLHLDIKPANILVTAEGEPKLLDFGIARVLTDGLGAADQADTTLRLLTPRYASPEQAAGRPLGTASDVFSLGTMLYRLLTGRLPYALEGASPLEAARLIRDVAPLQPSGAAPAEVQPLLRGDLDTILLQALRKEPERRYPTVAALAEDLRRHLDDKPVRAHADSFSYRTRKFLRRHRAGVAASAAVAAVVVASVFAVVRSAVVAKRQERLAEQRFQDVRKLAHSYIFDLDAQLTEIPGTVKVRASVLQNALLYLDAMSAEKADDADLMAELAKGYMRAAQVQSRVGVPSLSDEAGAKKSLLKSLALEQKLTARSPADAAARLLLVSNLRMLADQERGNNNLRGSEEYALQAWEAGQPLLQEGPHEAGLNAMMRIALVLAQNRGAASEGATLGDPQGALTWLDRLHALIVQYAALPAGEQLAYFNDNMLRHELVVRASVLRQLDRKPEARAIYEHALPVSQRMVGTSLTGTVGDMVLHYTYAEFLLETHDAQRAGEIAPPAMPVLLMENGANRVQLVQLGDLLSLHARIDLERRDLARARAEMQQCEETFEALHRQKPADAGTNDQMAASFFDIAQETNLDAASRRHLFERGLEVLQAGLAANPENLEDRTMDAEGRLRLVQALQQGGAVSAQERRLIDEAEADLRLILAKQPGQTDATAMMKQAEDLRTGKKGE